MGVISNMKLQILTQKATHYEPDISLLAEKESGCQEFIKRFPLESLRNLTIEEYANTKTKDCFNYWLEQKNILGGIGGANAAKFGIYRAKTGEYCQGYGKQKMVLKGEQLQEEFRALKEGIYEAIRLAKEDRISEIVTLNLPIYNMVLLKILNIYVPERFFNIYSPPILIELGKELHIKDELLTPQNAIALNHAVLHSIKKQNVFLDWSNEKISRFIWDTFSERDKPLDKNTNYWLAGHTYGKKSFYPRLFIEKQLHSNRIFTRGFILSFRRREY